MTLELSKSMRWSDGRMISTAETLLHRAVKPPSTSQGKNTEINHVTDALRVNNYPTYVISNILKRKFSKPPTLYPRA